MRILVDAVRDCYAAHGHHARALAAGARSVQGLRRDAAVQHVPVAAHHGDRPDGKPLEVQIRTHDMHRTAEYGIAAHWRTRRRRGTQGAATPSTIDDMPWLRQLLDWQREAADPGEFLETLRYDLVRRRSSSSRPRAT